MQNELTIGDVARRAGLRPSAIRYYESAGILPPPRRVNGRRRYAADVLDQLALIRFAQQAGFTVAEMRALLHGFPAETPAAERWQALARRKLADIETLLAEVRTMQRLLEHGLRCTCLTLEDCARHIRAAPPGGMCP